MDIATGVITFLELTKAVIDYIEGVKAAKEDKRALLGQLRHAESLLTLLRDLEKSDTGQTYLNATRKLISEGGLKLYEDSLQELLALSKKSRFKWPFIRDDLTKHLDRIDRANNLFTLVISRDDVKLSSAIHEEVQHVQESVHGVKESVEELQRKNRTDEESRILDWISIFNPETDHVRVAKARLSGTGQWFLNDQKFIEWRQSQKPGGFWALGNPGVGKTVLSSLVIDELFENEFEQQDIGVAYFYLDYTQRETHNATFLLRSILRQLCALKASLPRALIDFHSLHSRKGRPIFAGNLVACLTQVIQEFERVFVVIDALDEFEEGQERNELLNSLTSLAETSLKVIVTSRPHPNDIRRRLSDFTSFEVEANPDDVKLFLNGTIDNDEEALEIIERDESLREDVVDTLMERARGMFLLPQLQIQGILKQQSPRDMREALENLPNRLDSEFHKTWERIRSQDDAKKPLAEKTLTWLSYARTPLSVDELRDALSVRPKDTRFDSTGRPSSKGIISSCFGLVIPDTVNDTIRFVHYSVQEYFHKREKQHFPTGQSYIAEVCMTYLTFEDFSQICMNRQALDNRLEQYPFLRYAACYWGHHCSQSNEQSKPEDENLGEKAYHDIIEDPCVYESMLQALCSFDDSWGIGRDGAVRGLVMGISKYHFAAAFGLVSVLLKLFESKTGDEFIERDARGRFPIHYAAANGHEGTITLLLGMHLADLAVTDNDGRTPFALAANAGQKGVTRLLLEEQGIKVDTKDRNGETPLALAARGGHLAFIEMLLLRGSINLNARCMFYGITPLIEASYNGHVEVVRTLIKHPGVFVEARETLRRTSLSLAAENNHVETVQALLESPEVDLNSEDMRGHTPLFHAAWSGAYEMVKYLLSLPNIAVNQRSHFGETPLSIAARTGHDSCVRLLLQDSRVEVNTQDYERRTPLEHAVRQGHRNVVRLLLEDPRVELSTKNEWKRTPLDYAVRGHHHQIVEMLQVEIEQRKDQSPKKMAMYLGQGRPQVGIAAA